MGSLKESHKLAVLIEMDHDGTSILASNPSWLVIGS